MRNLPFHVLFRSGREEPSMPAFPKTLQGLRGDFVEASLIAKLVGELVPRTEIPVPAAGELQLEERAVDVGDALNGMEWHLILEVQKVTDEWQPFRTRDGFTHDGGEQSLCVCGDKQPWKNEVESEIGGRLSSTLRGKQGIVMIELAGPSLDNI